MKDLFESSYKGSALAGVDEVGRGPLAGDVVAAAVILDPQQPIEGLRDSKKLTAARREELAQLIRSRALGWSIASASVAEIDEMNILQASLLAMHRAVQTLQPQPEYILVDGNRLPRWHYASEAVVGGDDRVPAIAAASILAKVHRDNALIALDRVWICCSQRVPHSGAFTGSEDPRCDAGSSPQLRSGKKNTSCMLAFVQHLQQAV
jgi:ribonuclease HII